MYENGFKKEDVSVEWDGFDVMKETDIIVRAGDSLLLTVKVEGATYYPLTDIQGTVWGYVDSQNSIVAQWRYDAWGNAVGGNVSVPALARLRYRFQGREWSAATGLVNFRMRWYDSETGRWLSKDPIGLGGGLNLYAFCENNPICNLDWIGLCPDENDDSDYWDRYFEITDSLMIDPTYVLPVIPITVVPKKWAPSTGGRAPALGSNNWWTSMPSALGADKNKVAREIFRGNTFRGISSLSGVGLWGAGIWNFGVGVGAFIGAFYGD